jgi:hypothetical protein
LRSIEAEVGAEAGVEEQLLSNHKHAYDRRRSFAKYWEILRSLVKSRTLNKIKGSVAERFNALVLKTSTPKES